MGGVMRAIFGGGEKPKAPKPPPAPAPAAAAAAPGPAGAAAPGASPEDFKKQQTAYWQNLFAGLGQGQPGDQLPESIQQNIESQAANIK